MRSTVYGVELEVDNELPPALTDTFPPSKEAPPVASSPQGSAPLHLRRVPDGPTLRELTKSAAPTFESPTRHTSAVSALRFWDLPDRSFLWFTGIAGFWLSDGEIGVALRGPDQARAAGIHLLGTVLPFWLERRGFSALHAAAVSVGGRGIVFAGGNGAGKSTLVASLLASGAQLLTDDVAVMVEEAGRIQVLPAVPWVRMWPDAARHWTGREPAEFDRVLPTVDKVRIPVGDGAFGAFGAFGTFGDHPCPVEKIVLPVRTSSDESVRLEGVPARDALIELIRHSSVPRLLEAVKLRSTSFERWAKVVDQVPVYRLTVPDGLERLPEVHEVLGA